MADQPRPKRRKRTAIAPAPPARYQAFIDGVLTVDDLDDEEIFKMRIRDKNGSFTGRPPTSIPKVFLEAMQREQHKRFTAGMAEMVQDANDTIARILSPLNPGGPGDMAKLKAAQFVIERFAGKTPDNVNIKAEVHNTWQNLEAEILMDVEEEDDDFDTKA